MLAPLARHFDRDADVLVLTLLVDSVWSFADFRSVVDDEIVLSHPSLSLFSTNVSVDRKHTHAGGYGS